MKKNCRLLFLLFVILFGLTIKSQAQVILTGHVTDKKSNFPLYPTTVLDSTSGKATYADSTGFYKIEAKAGDVIQYRYLGFYTQRYKVPKGAEYIEHNVSLISKKQKLQTVNISALTPYEQDSLDRIKTFGHYLHLPVAHLLDPTFSNGISFHPFTYFSKKERRKRKFHRMYKKFEKNAFIDSRYTPHIVHKLTGLSKDSLRIFMFHHRPPYRFTRTASKILFWSWITYNCRKWRDSLTAASNSKKGN